MKYFKNPTNEKVYGYDPVTQIELIAEALANEWVDVTDSWPPIAQPTPEYTAEQVDARIYLNQTDWYVVRLAETGKPVPPDVLTRRAAARLLL